MLARVVCSKNNLFFAFLVLSYVFGVVLYDYLSVFSSDEVMALFLLFFTGMVVNERRCFREVIPLCVVAGIFLFYTLYSVIIGSNVLVAILKDLLIEIKPFLGFFCTYAIMPTLSPLQKRSLVIMCLVVAALLLFIGIMNDVVVYFGHPACFAKTIVATAFLYLYCCSDEWPDFIGFLLILTVGLFSTRAKFYGFWGVAFLLVFLYKAGIRIKFDFKSIILLLCVGALAVWLGRDNLIMYYVDGMLDSREMWSRPAILLTSLKLFVDYAPLGSGLASFASYASGEYYSHIYEDYGINHLWGISREFYSFVADAYYPMLAQFGIVGLGLYIFFWIWMVRKGRAMRKQGFAKEELLILLATVFFAIEGVADSTFSQNRGLFVLIVAAMALTKGKEHVKAE